MVYEATLEMLGFRKVVAIAHPSHVYLVPAFATMVRVYADSDEPEPSISELRFNLVARDGQRLLYRWDGHWPFYNSDKRCTSQCVRESQTSLPRENEGGLESLFTREEGSTEAGLASLFTRGEGSTEALDALLATSNTEGTET